MGAENPLADFFSDHLKELRQRVLVAFCSVVIFIGIAYIFSRPIASFLMQPIFQASTELQGLVYTHLTEAFISYLKVAVLVGVAASFPVLCYELWMFVSPGLRRREKRTALVVSFWATVLFLGGVVFAYFVALPQVLTFMMSFSGDQLTPMPRLDSYLTFVARTSLAFGLAFEIPFLMVVAARVGLVKHRYFIEKRWLSYAGILLLAFLLAAGDFLGALLLALPLFLLYETGIVMATILGRRASEPAMPPDGDDLSG